LVINDKFEFDGGGRISVY